MASFYNKLIEIGLCKRCALRYLGVRDATAYEELGEHAVKYNGQIITVEHSCEDVEPASKMKKKNTCLTCLGLLENLVDDDAIKMICERVLAENYDSPVVACAVSLPIATQLRAHALEIYLQCESLMFNPRQVVPLKEAWKWTCSQRIAKGIGKTACSGAACDFLVNINVEYAEDKNECSPLQEIHSEKFDERRRQKRKFRGEMFTRQNVESLLSRTSSKKFQEAYSCPPLPPSVCVSYSDISCTHSSIFIAGRYNKFSRELSQTPWVVEGERRMEGSVQELISDSLESFVRTKPSKFLSSGREDVDVRTLGRGRPFAVELPDPHRVQLSPEQLASLQDSINSSSNMLVVVRDLQVVPKEELVKLKLGEEMKSKTYEAYCVCLKGSVATEKLQSLSTIKDLVLSQKTPIRVLHRRPLATRNRTIIEMEATRIDDKHFKLNLQTQAGTYVKEFVHGDFGRTLPNLGTLLGVPVDILALDVQEVQLDWPKPI